LDSRWARWPIAIAIPLAMLAWAAWSNRSEDLAHIDRPFRELHGTESVGERRALASLLDESYAVLRSPELQDALGALAAQYPAIYARKEQPNASPAEIADFVALKTPGSRYVQVDVRLIDGAPDFLGMAGEHGAGVGRYADIVLVRPVLGAWTAQDLVMRSCAINVAAHEYAHTLSTSPIVYDAAVTDTRPGEGRIAGRTNRTAPVASYLLGTIAQCVWLERQGRIRPGGLAGCVEVFGVNSGNPARCDDFTEGQAVAPRPDLPPLRPPL
jgi:hypothetical protein